MNKESLNQLSDSVLQSLYTQPCYADASGYTHDDIADVLFSRGYEIKGFAWRKTNIEEKEVINSEYN